MEDYLTHQFKTDPGGSFRTVFDELYKPLCAFALNYVPDAVEAEDIIQDLFVKLWEQRNHIVFNTSIKAYLFQSARNGCLNYIKHKSVESKYLEHYVKVSPDSFYENALEVEETRRLLNKAVESLPPRCRQIFELSRFAGKSIDEISELLSLSKNTIKNQLVSALKRIRTTIELNELLIFILLFFHCIAILFIVTAA